MNKDSYFDEVTKFEEVHIPQSDQPDLVGNEPNQWCVDRQWQIYWDAKMLNAKAKRTHPITE